MISRCISRGREGIGMFTERGDIVSLRRSHSDMRGSGPKRAAQDGTGGERQHTNLQDSQTTETREGRDRGAGERPFVTLDGDGGRRARRAREASSREETQV